MKKYEIPDYYTDDSLTEEEKRRKDMEMIANDFPKIADESAQNITNI